MNNVKGNSWLCPNDVIQGHRIYLKPPGITDLSFIRTLWSDTDTMAPVGGPVDFPEDKAEAWFAWMVYPGSPVNCYCLIFNNKTIPIGEISFHRWDPEERIADLNVKVLASYRGHGYAKDALRAFLSFFFGRVGGRVMTDDVSVDNHVGQRLLYSFGFDTDDTVLNVRRMVMTKDMYATRYGKLNK